MSKPVSLRFPDDVEFFALRWLELNPKSSMTALIVKSMRFYFKNAFTKKELAEIAAVQLSERQDDDEEPLKVA